MLFLIICKSANSDLVQLPACFSAHLWKLPIPIIVQLSNYRWKGSAIHHNQQKMQILIIVQLFGYIHAVHRNLWKIASTITNIFPILIILELADSCWKDDARHHTLQNNHKNNHLDLASIDHHHVSGILLWIISPCKKLLMRTCNNIADDDYHVTNWYFF